MPTGTITIPEDRFIVKSKIFVEMNVNCMTWNADVTKQNDAVTGASFAN